MVIHARGKQISATRQRAERLRKTMIPNNGTIEFSKTNLTKGLYNLKIIDDKETVVLKIIIN
jgi:hypothetical protein